MQIMSKEEYFSHQFLSYNQMMDVASRKFIISTSHTGTSFHNRSRIPGEIFTMKIYTSIRIKHDDVVILYLYVDGGHKEGVEGSEHCHTTWACACVAEDALLLCSFHLWWL